MGLHNLILHDALLYERDFLYGNCPRCQHAGDTCAELALIAAKAAPRANAPLVIALAGEDSAILTMMFHLAELSHHLLTPML